MTLFINNEFVNSLSGKIFPVLNPSTAERICDVQEGSKADIDVAVEAAKNAVKLGSPWRRMDASKRGLLINKLADLIERDGSHIRAIEAIEAGMVQGISGFDLSVGLSNLRYQAGWADKIHGKTIPIDGDYFCYTRREPVGVVGAILPWNFPMFLTCIKLGAALACGNTVVIKPSEETPLATLYIGSLIVEAGFPPGVVNIVSGYGKTAGAAIAEHMDVDLVSFTGSIEVGKLVQQAAGRTNLKRVCLELGGKSPTIVFADADIDYAVEVGHRSVFSHSGQLCVAGSRLFVQDEIYEEFVKKAVRRAKQGKVGSPEQEGVERGPQINQAQVDKIIRLIESGKKEGAILNCGGARVANNKGYFIESTVFSDVTDDMQIAKEEIFGPVQQIMRFKTIEEVIERANKTHYGLASAVFTKDLDKALTIANSMKAGTVWVNIHGMPMAQAPQGGYKMSGIGRECGEEIIQEYTEVKTVIIKIPEKNS
ncbi:aldehyde dehydrogenase 1A1-like isoform X2 [Amphiura filiformis]|uniref:aldehyde dehydrogenase 1A1-like isoform X2 n=1 Tax=Amphiura filiformis TaxID=82378 RepID=UPI003B21651D